MKPDENYKAYNAKVQEEGSVFVYKGNVLFLQEKLPKEGMF